MEFNLFLSTLDLEFELYPTSTAQHKINLQTLLWGTPGNWDACHIAMPFKGRGTRS